MKSKFSAKRFLKYIIISGLIFIFVLIMCDDRITKAILDISYIQAKQRANTAIDEAVNYNISEMNLKTEDFFIYVSDDAYSANLLVINKFSSGVSTYITDFMKDMSRKEIEVPLGFLTGIDIFSNIGPCIKIYVVPIGAASINTKSEVLSAGINQVNYKVYLNIEIESKIIMPFKEESVIFKRDILLIDAVIKGDIPETYLNLNENLK